jgi:hypothetical protein
MTTCPNPKCGSELSQVVESRLMENGDRRRRRECDLCGHRWSTTEGCSNGQSSPRRRARNPCLSTEQIRLILTRLDIHPTAMAADVGCTPETVRLVRIGRIHGKVLPELARERRRSSRQAPAPITGPSCERCHNWSGDHCGMGFPDPLEEGLGFAADCETYQESL